MKIFKQILKRKSDPNTHQNALSKIISRGGGGMPPNPPQNLEKNSCLPPPPLANPGYTPVLFYIQDLPTQTYTDMKHPIM